MPVPLTVSVVKAVSTIAPDEVAAVPVDVVPVVLMVMVLIWLLVSVIAPV